MFSDDNFEFYENGVKFSEWTENDVGKGEIACHEQFLLFLTVFKRLVLQTHKDKGLFGKGLRALHTVYIPYIYAHTIYSEYCLSDQV